MQPQHPSPQHPNQQHPSSQQHPNQPHPNQLFILQQHHHYTFPQPYQKVLGACPMLNNTLLIFAIKSHLHQAVIHLSPLGTVLKQHSIPTDSFLMSFGIVTDRTAVWLDVHRNKIVQWNVQTYEIVEVGFDYVDGDRADSQDLYLFSETKLACIVEKGGPKSNYIKFSYFQMPFSKESQPVLVFQSSQQQLADNLWCYEQQVKKGNCQSLFIWYRTTQKQQISFKTLQIQYSQQTKKYQPLYKEHSLKNQLKVDTRTVQFSIGSIWSMPDDKYMLVTITDRPNSQTQYPNNIFIYQPKDSILREAHFALQSQYRLQILDYYHLASTAVIHTFHHIAGKPQPSPVYFLDLIHQRIAGRAEWTCSHLHKLMFPCYDGNVVVDGMYENGDVRELEVREMKVVEVREMWVMLMEGWFGGVDANLVREGLNMLVEE